MGRSASRSRAGNLLHGVADLLTVQLESDHTNGGRFRHHYLVAGVELQADRPISGLEEFGTAGRSVVAPQRELRQPAPRPGSGTLLHDDEGWVGGRKPRVVCRYQDVGYVLEVQRGGSYFVSQDGELIVRLEEEQAEEEIAAGDVVLGPCLCLSLALRGTFCLHAAAVEAAGRVLALAGESGSGKSTLAHRLTAEPDTAWRRAGDDILPVRRGGGGWEALLRFPQLKLKAEDQWPAARPGSLPLAALIQMAPTAGGVRPTAKKLSRRDGALAVIRHTVAGRLFSPEVRRRHFTFASALVEDLPVYRLDYPMEWGRLPEVREAVAGLLG